MACNSSRPSAFSEEKQQASLQGERETEPAARAHFFAVFGDLLNQGLCHAGGETEN